MSDIEFAKMVMKLAAKVRMLEDHPGRFGRKAIRKNLNTARALSDELWSKMGKEGIDPLKYREILIDIEYGLESIEENLDQPNTSIWERVMNLFMSAIEFWFDLFGMNRSRRLVFRPAVLALPFPEEPTEAPPKGPNGGTASKSQEEQAKPG